LLAAQRFSPDTILLDIGLPGMDGYEVARRLREQPGTEQTLIIALSGYSLSHTDPHGDGSGIDHYLLKPLDLSQLHDLLD
jgi:CheY-like chemotaxis protein